MKFLAVLLTVHNRKDKTLSCLEKLHSQLPVEGWKTEVFLTDDGCTDGTPEAIAQQFPKVNIIKGDGNLYWNRGMRLAWETAAKSRDFDAYLWLNDDTMLLDGGLECMIKSHALAPDAIIVGTTKSFSTDSPTYGGLDHKENVIIPDGTLKECVTFHGNIVFIPSIVFKAIGFLDNYYHHSLGDVDYGFTATKLGIRALIAPVFIGNCENNPLPPKWMIADLPLKVRWNNLFSPLAYTNPKEYFHYKKKHWNVFIAVLAVCSIALHFISPSLWSKLRYNRILK